MEIESASCISATELLDSYLDKQLHHVSTSWSARDKKSTNIDLSISPSAGSMPQNRSSCEEDIDSKWNKCGGENSIICESNIEEDINRLRYRMRSTISSTTPAERLCAESAELLHNLQMLKQKFQNTLSTDRSSICDGNALCRSSDCSIISQQETISIDNHKSRLHGRTGLSTCSSLSDTSTTLRDIRSGILSNSCSRFDRYLDDDYISHQRVSFGSVAAINNSDGICVESSSSLTAECIRRKYPFLFDHKKANNGNLA